jgi:ribosomal protein L11 methyltransferase
MKEINAAHEGQSSEHQWVEISVVLDRHLQDALANFLMERGADGVVTDGDIAAPLIVSPLSKKGEYRQVTAYLKNDKAIRSHIDSLHRYLAALADIHDLSDAPQVELKLIREEDWSKQWQKHFSTCRVGRSMVIKPSWEEYLPQSGDVVIEMDPGMAFGTGAHPTTRMCLERIEDLIRRSDPPVCRMLDVGTGSGILSIAAAKLGIEKVVGVDIDPIALGYARKNAVINRVAQRVEVRDCPLEMIGEQFDLILANILSEILLRLRTQLLKRLTARGILVLSGILAEDAHKIETAFSSKKYRLLDSRLQGEWACLVLQKQLA